MQSEISAAPHDAVSRIEKRQEFSSGPSVARRSAPAGKPADPVSRIENQQEVSWLPAPAGAWLSKRTAQPLVTLAPFPSQVIWDGAVLSQNGRRTSATVVEIFRSGQGDK